MEITHSLERDRSHPMSAAIDAKIPNSSVWTNIGSKLHRITNIVTIDNAAKVSIAACTLLGCSIMASGDFNDIVDGFAVATSGASLVTAIWGTAYALQGKTKAAAKRFLIAGALAAGSAAAKTLNAMTETGFNNSESGSALGVPETQNPRKLEAFYRNSILDPSPLSGKHNPINKEKAQLWIDAHRDRTARQIAAKFIENTRYVSHDEFETHLKNCVEQFNDSYFPLRNKKNKFIIVTTDSFKSNHWVASIAIKYFKQFPDDVIYLEEVESYVANHPEVNTFLHLDDAAYSCKQSKEMIATLDTNIYYGKYGSQQKMEYTIVSIIPFVKSPNCMIPGDATTRVQSIYSEIIKPLKEVLDKDELQNFYRLYGGIEQGVKIYLEDRFPIYFAHKIADNWSSFPGIYKTGIVSPRTLSFWDWGSIEEKKVPFIEKIITPYKEKACEKFSNPEFCKNIFS